MYGDTCSVVGSAKKTVSQGRPGMLDDFCNAIGASVDVKRQYTVTVTCHIPDRLDVAIVTPNPRYGNVIV